MSEDILVMPDSYLQKTKSMEFGVGHTMESHTNEVRFIKSSQLPANCSFSLDSMEDGTVAGGWRVCHHH